MQGVVRILLVEDNEDHAELIKRAFEVHGLKEFSLFHLKDGQEALDYLHRRGRFFDSAMSPIPALIMLDLRLPKIDGLDVLRVIKESDETKRIPVVILTTSDSARDKCLAYGVHPNSYLLKPYDIDELFELIGNLLSYWLKRNPDTEINPGFGSNSTATFQSISTRHLRAGEDRE